MEISAKRFEEYVSLRWPSRLDTLTVSSRFAATARG